MRFTGKKQSKWEDTSKPVVVITTYSMISVKRAKENEYVQKIQQRKGWSICVIDEVHRLCAQTFQNVLKNFRFNFKLGLTATPYREDQKINNLIFMIGPKLYEENWQDLVRSGYLARPYCIEIRCQMSEVFAEEYKTKSKADRQLYHTANPIKLDALQFLIKTHEDRGDKILVFCDRYSPR